MNKTTPDRPRNDFQNAFRWLITLEVLVRSRTQRKIVIGAATALIAAGVAYPVIVSLTANAAATADAGATTPFTVLEAESASPGGGATVASLTSAPTTQYASPALEASGHSYVHLAAPGQNVTFTNNTGKPITAINVRESIPDSSGGGGLTATLNLYVNGAYRQALNVNSKQSWLYEGNNNYNGDDQNPADGDPRVFFDEAHTFVTGDAIAPGATFAFQKDAANTAGYYDIDSVDVEQAPAPLAQPDGSLSLTDCGAVADNNPTNGTGDPAATDSYSAIQNCINQAQSSHRTLWIPQGTFYLKGTQGLNADGITIAGAGYWYSEIYRQVPLPNHVGLGAIFGLTSCTVQNFHLDTNAQSRATVDGDGGAMDTSGTNWVANGIWSQHVESGFWASGTGGTAENNRLTDIWADGLNLNNVSLGNTVGHNLTAENNYIRGTGDDAMAINSVNYNTNSDGSKTYYTAMHNITLKNNSLIAPWGGKGIGIYGGSDQDVENNYIADTARYIGLGMGRFGVNGSDLTGATVTNNVVVRAGGNAYNQGQPAVQIGNGGDGQNVGTVTGITASNNTVSNALYDAVDFSTSNDNTLRGTTITSPWRNGIVISTPYYPAPTGTATITGNTITGLRSGMTAYHNNSTGFTANVSGNNWQSGGTTPPTTDGPYGATAAAVPGTVQAENYDTGGPGVGYKISSVDGGGGYRTDSVDLEATSDTGGGYNLGWTRSGQWQRYTVNVASAGTYGVAFRVSAPSAVADAFHLTSSTGANLSGTIAVPATGAWQSWTTVTGSVTLPAGQQVLTLDQDNGGWNINYLTFTSTGGPSTIDPTAWYTVANQNSGACIDATESGTVNGTAVQQWSCGGSLNQEWQLSPISNGYYEVLNRNSATETQAWDVAGGPSAITAGTKIQTWSYGGGTNQLWQPVPVGSGWLTFVVQSSGMCLTVTGSSTASGALLEQDPCNGSTAQSFKLTAKS